MFKGTATALITPFSDTGVDFEALDKLLDSQVDGGVNALVILGTTGEPATMTKEEKVAVVKFVVNKLKGKLPIIVGAGANSTADAIDNAKLYTSLGADGLLVVTPYYNKCTQGGLVAHYTAVAEATHLPIICYNVPGRTGVNMLPATFAKLVDQVDNIVAIKEASGNMEQIEECIRLTAGKADVISGDDGLTVPVMLMGGTGDYIFLSSPASERVSAAALRAFESYRAAFPRRIPIDVMPGLPLERSPDERADTLAVVLDDRFAQIVLEISLAHLLSAESSDRTAVCH